jgi:hypothetical protein
VTGRVTRGKLKVGVDVDLVGYDRFFKAKVNGEHFHIEGVDLEQLRFRPKLTKCRVPKYRKYVMTMSILYSPPDSPSPPHKVGKFIVDILKIGNLAVNNLMLHPIFRKV